MVDFSVLVSIPVVIGLVSRVAPLNNETGVIFLSSKGKIAAKDLSLEMVAGGILLVSDCFGLDSRLLDMTSSGVTKRLK
ncbi:hypothetical protein G9A89_019438 [Geosiphon pyriformis]|nr:hypothetical protein G9A89_019438 [Geosiphon pyriformis]